MPATRVGLRPLRLSDADLALRWSRDVAFCSANGWRLDLTNSEIKDWLLSSAAGGQPDLLRLGIEAGHHLIGYVDLADITATSAEFGIAIGESDQWGRGLGTVAGELLLRHAFDDLGLRRIDAEVSEANARSLRLMHRLGFHRVQTNPALGLHAGVLASTVNFERHRQAQPTFPPSRRRGP